MVSEYRSEESATVKCLVKHVLKLHCIVPTDQTSLIYHPNAGGCAFNQILKHHNWPAPSSQSQRCHQSKPPCRSLSQLILFFLVIFQLQPSQFLLQVAPPPPHKPPKCERDSSSNYITYQTL